MGLSFAFLIYSHSGRIDLSRPNRDPAASGEVMRALFPRTPYTLRMRKPLLEVCFPEREEPAVGVFEDGILIATCDAHLYDPDILHRRYLRQEYTNLQLITSRSYNDMVAYGMWHGARLVRCLSMNSVAGVWRDEGHDAVFDETVPSQPERWLDVANAVLADALRLAGDVSPPVAREIDWDAVALDQFTRSDR